MAERRALSAQPLLLAVESATAVASVAVLRGEQLLARRASRRGQHHSESLLPMLDAVLDDLGCGLSEIEVFAVSIGPGAFTSLRIGLATVKGLAFGDDRPVVPVSTLEALALSALRRHGDRARPEIIVAALDAQRGEAYAAGWRALEQRLEPELAEGVYGAAELLARLPSGGLVVGEGAALLGDELRQRGGVGLELEPEPFTLPDASAVGLLALRGLARGDGLPAAELVPRYVRRAEAEVVRTARRFE